MVEQNIKTISHLYQKIFHFFIKHKTYTSFLFVMTVIIVLFGIFGEKKTNTENFFVKRDTIKQYVKVSGQVESSKDANLSFQTTGSVAFVGVKVGDVVEQGKVLATLSAGDQQASLLQAEANLANAKAVLDQLIQGARKEEIAIKEQSVENAKTSLDQAYSSLPDAIQNVDAVTADVIKNKFSPLFVLSNGRFQMTFSSCNQHLQSELESKRFDLENALADFQTKSSIITNISSIENIDKTFEMAYKSAILTNELVNGISNLLLSSCSIGNSSLDSFRNTLSSVKTTMTALFSDITSKRISLINAKNNFNQAKKDLDLTKAGTDPYKIKAQSAIVSQAEAQVAQAKSGLSKTLIVAPFIGVISDVNVSLGETVSIGKTVIEMIATDGFQIEAKVPEIDIVKIKTGLNVDVTLDAYGKDIIFPATVTRINPTATTEGTVPVYKVVVTFVGKDIRIKQGMTANVNIVTETKNNIIAVPARFVKIITSDKGMISLMQKDGEIITREISLGVRGVNGLIEVVSGLVGGEELLVPTTTERQAQKQNS